MSDHPRFWQIDATLTFTTSDGWTTTRQAPTFALIANVQGIYCQESAKAVASDIILTALDESVTDVHVSVSVLPFD